MKFIHNGNCVPLLELYEPGYDVAQFLAFTQHVQYVKTKGLAYVSSSIGRDMFCEGNLQKAVESFEDEARLQPLLHQLSEESGRGKERHRIWSL
ncbi:hypothetical protein JVT61DRAFT_13300 [Boletus reticuloceps]|uniref:Uncharacterized protein n=1 Tax=Boletus reticuloceps TaxID=495285 RepID=A0A8I2YTM9_9AGAM|nr:hypothetical protein JVT61DRAFT_13300 [Boletus reticuloceps]